MSAIKIIVWNHVGNPSLVAEDPLLLELPQSSRINCDDTATESAKIIFFFPPCSVGSRRARAGRLPFVVDFRYVRPDRAVKMIKSPQKRRRGVVCYMFMAVY